MAVLHSLLCLPTWDEYLKRVLENVHENKKGIGQPSLSPFAIPSSLINSIPVLFSDLLFMKAPKARKAAGCDNEERHQVSRQWPKFASMNLVMDINVKLLKSSDGSNHLIIIISGLINAEGLMRIFRQVAAIIQQHFDCKVLIDFEKASFRLEAVDIDDVVHELGPDLRLGNIKIALVSPIETGESERLKLLSDSLCGEDLRAAMFDNAKEAVHWLVDAT